MARTSTEDTTLGAIEGRAIGRGALAGVVAGLAMGVVLQFGTDLLPVLGAFAGSSTPLVGWFVHLVVATVYGALYAAVVGYPAIADFLPTEGLGSAVVLGVTYATMIAAVSIAVLPFVFSLPWVPSLTWGGPAGAAGRPSIGLVAAGLFAVAHLLYGGLLGAGYAVLAGDAS